MKKRTSKKTTTKAKKTTTKKPAKKTVKKVTKKTTKKPAKKTAKKVKPAKKTKVKKAKAGGMSEYEQCIVLAAIVNQQRNADTRFLFTPLPDINSSKLAPLRDILSDYHFSVEEIIKAAHKVFQSKKFEECFALHEPVKETLLKISQADPKALIHELIKLAGPEAKKSIYMQGNHIHDIHQTTLEKHALKLGLIEEPPHIDAEPFQKQDHHKKIIIKLNFQNKGRNLHQNLMRFSGKQHRGRG